MLIRWSEVLLADPTVRFELLRKGFGLGADHLFVAMVDPYCVRDEQDSRATVGVAIRGCK